MGRDEKIMEYDPDAGSFDYGLRVLKDTLVVGRKEYTCCHCAGPIAIKERHRVQTGVLDGEAKSCRWCAACCDAMVLDYDEDDCNHMEARIQLHNPEYRLDRAPQVKP